MVLGLAMLAPHRLCRGPMVPWGATIRPLAPLSRYRPQRYFGNQGLAAQQACVQAMVVDQAAGDFQIDGAVPHSSAGHPVSISCSPGATARRNTRSMTSGSVTYSPLVQTAGVTPLPVRTPPAGGTACDQVMLSSLPFGRGTTVWIVPFPYEELPMTTARSRSCSTAATISAA